MSFKHLKELTATKTISEDSFKKQYDSSENFESAHNMISSLLKKAKMIATSDQHRDWAQESAMNADNDKHEISDKFDEMIIAIQEAIEANDDYYKELTHAFGLTE
jgi:predicted MPP superfamily phosphohydrolase